MTNTPFLFIAAVFISSKQSELTNQHYRQKNYYPSSKGYSSIGIFRGICQGERLIGNLSEGFLIRDFQKFNSPSCGMGVPPVFETGVFETGVFETGVFETGVFETGGTPVPQLGNLLFGVP